MGFSVFQYSPKRSVDGTVYRLREIGTEGQVTGQEYGPISGAWTFGLGAKFDLNYRWSVQFDINARIAFTDYLDDVSTVYPDVNQLGNQKGAIAAFYRTQVYRISINKKSVKEAFKEVILMTAICL